MEGCSAAPKKISLNIRGSGKKSAFNKDLVQHDTEVKEETDYVTEVTGNRIKGTRKIEKKKELIVPALVNESLIQRKNRLKYGAYIDREVKQEIKEELLNNEDVTPETVSKASSVISDHAENQPDTSLENPIDPSYEEMPIEEFGMALLRGMGKKSKGGHDGRSSVAVQPIEVKIRPKGLGLGAEQLLRSAQEQQEYENKKKGNQKEKLIVKSGAFVKIIEGTYKGKYGQVLGIDEDAARVYISLALTKDKVACNEALVIAVGKQEYNDFGKCLNRDRYDDYKRKHEGYQGSRQSETIDLTAGFQDDRSRMGHGENGKKSKKTKVDNKRPFIGYWLQSQLRVRVVDDNWKDGRFANEKVVIEDVISRDVCFCRTDNGRLLEDVHMDMLETVLPRSTVQATVPVMVVAGKYKGQVGHIVERDKKACVAYVQFVHDKKVYKLDFDYICEYVGQVSY
ncbi:G patch domain and KOW motifs-containing protein-like isoform X1 [Varroa jacobsoni]|uniref:G patch domain and KOW motifs-containing protein-like isoform X1 n=1 Tax=Varroa jacobsoni TaxID=62625 RepID=UPI000BFA27FA|nr:G patch domain and KOW motifs-containing protein-like isoform X1 [Varroa jacobsoni]